MRYMFSTIILLVVITTDNYSQKGDYGIVDDLQFYSDIMANAYEPATRQRAAVHFNELFIEFVSLPSAFQELDQDFKFLSILSPESNDFKLISWLTKGDNEIYDFFGYIIFSDGTFQQLKRSEPLSNEHAYLSNSADDWYGCLYYKLMELEENQYLLFGLDPSTKYDNLKLLDVMTINNKEVSFGSAIFEDKEERGTFLNRLILNFSSDAAVTLNYNEKSKMIIHDHLESRMGLQAGQGVTSLPDGTYEGYFYSKGKWMYKEKLFDHIYEEAPRPKPVFSDKPKTDEKVKLK